jgi:hypothetical protein
MESLLMLLTGGSAFNTFLSQQMQAGAFAAQGQYEKRIYDSNADIADLKALDALERGRQLAGRTRRDTGTFLGAQRGAIAESGIQLDVGTASDFLDETALIGEAEAVRVGNDAAREAWGFKVESRNLRMQGLLARRAGRNAARGARLGSIGTLLTGAARTTDIYLDR